MEDKQNTTPNKQAPLFSNPLINSKLDPPPLPTPQCKQHNNPLFPNSFCPQCLSYRLCRQCLRTTHLDHEVMQFTNRDQLIIQTKEMLLEGLEETLKELKSRENQVKNMVHEGRLIRTVLRGIEEEIVAVISAVFRDIQGNLLTAIEQTEQNYNQEVQQFFKQFNQINDSLRQNLMKILDGKIDPIHFHRSMIKQEPPKAPNFLSYKDSMQRYKRIFKDVRVQLTKVTSTLQKGLQSLKNSSNNGLYENSRASNQNQMKLDKYINGFNVRGDKVNQSFMKTLRLIQMGADKDVGVAKAKGNCGKANLRVF